MSEGGRLINVNLGDLSKPATVLIEKISDAVGEILRPGQIKRVAKAEAEAAEIRALSDIKITRIQQRGLARLIQEEGKKQANIERITALALPDLKADAKPENIENDWLAHFFEKCRIVSDTEMQSLWARLLAGEANKPGAFSRRTVEFVATLDKEDAQLFTNLCRFGWSIGDGTELFIYSNKADIYNHHGINFNVLTHLDDIGLITFNPTAPFGLFKLPKQLTVYYYGMPANLEFPNDSDNALKVGEVLLTKVGDELSPISGATGVKEFPSFVFSKWTEQGLKVSSSKDIPTSEHSSS
ncbi:MAG: DUF2806 domain-containing protein [Nitrospirae bacterium]|nr:MAG: DUF2806 domain-containing protein [Nitrospirota bacterium]